MHLWLPISLCTAFFDSMKDVFSKKSLVQVDEYIVAWAYRAMGFPFLLPILFFIPIPEIGPSFWTALIVSGTLNLITTFLYIKAVKSSDLSITSPMLTFSPVFLLITSPLITREFPTFWGICGILLIISGAYMLQIKEKSKGWLAPFFAMKKEKGPRYMLLVAFIWSISANFDKIGVKNSSPVFWSLMINLYLVLTLLPFLLILSRHKLKDIPKHIHTLLPMGIFSAAALLFHCLAIRLTLVAYAISIKRTSAVMSVVWGHYIFKEKGIKERLLGVLIMILGVLLIGFS
ncbi:MAG: EamA family transporter [Candidatus Aureabacteria bacterium]|nr:EamA family transporter [Candidatus Auribacterota bacterium]